MREDQRQTSKSKQTSKKALQEHHKSRGGVLVEYSISTFGAFFCAKTAKMQLKYARLQEKY